MPTTNGITPNPSPPVAARPAVISPRLAISLSCPRNACGSPPTARRDLGRRFQRQAQPRGQRRFLGREEPGQQAQLSSVIGGRKALGQLVQPGGQLAVRGVVHVAHSNGANA